MEEIKIPATRKETVFIVKSTDHEVVTRSGYPFHMIGDIWYAVHDGGRWIVIHKASGIEGTPRHATPIKTRAELIRLLNDDTYQEALEKGLTYNRSSEPFKRCVKAISDARLQYYGVREVFNYGSEDN